MKNLLLIGLLLTSWCSYSQSYDRITLDNGLSQSNINCITQDSTGFIWFGTNGGLNRYDGSEFKVFLHSKTDSTSIANNIINNVYIDEAGKIWVGTQNGLSIYDPTLDKFDNYKSELNKTSSLSNNIVTSIVKDTLGYYWIGTDGGGLNKFNPVDKSFTSYQYSIQNPYSISSNRVTSLERDRFGFIWVGTADKGVNMLEPGTGKFLRYVYSENSTNKSISDNQIFTIYEDFDGDLWIGTANGLNLFIPPKSGRSIESRDRIRTYTNRQNRNSLGDNSVLSIFQGKTTGTLYIGTNNGGLTSFNKNQGYFRNQTFNPNDPNGLLSNKITSIYDDAAGILWIGTNAGINLIDLLRERFVLYQRKSGTENTFSSNNIQTIYKEGNGTIWVGTFDEGLNRYNPRTGEYNIYKSDDIFLAGESLKEHQKILSKNRKKRRGKKNQQQLRFLSSNRILSLHRDYTPTMWIGTGGGGLNKLDLNTGKISWYKAVPENADSLSSDIVKVIYRDKKGIIWIGTEDGGLNRFNRRKFKRYIHDENDVLSISSNNITSITEDKKGNLWVGTFDGGLNLLNRENGTFRRYHHFEDDINGLSSNSIFYLHADDSSQLWIGTNEGLNKLDLINGKFEHYTTDDGLPSNFIYSILPDNEGNLWISTNKGVSKFNIVGSKAKNYDKLDGLQGNEFNAGAAFKTRRGEMLFGGINGFNSFYPNNIKDNEFIPDVVITNFMILGEKVPINTAGSPLKKHISKTKKITLSYKDKGFSFEFVALNFTHSEKNQYAYKMENFDNDWNYVGTRRFANYTNLPPGNYTFKVKASNNDGLWNEVGTELQIVITPPFYRTWWFYLLVFLFILISGYLFVLLRVRSLQKSKIVLRDLVRARTQQLSEEKTRVEKANSEITLQKNEIESQRNRRNQRGTQIHKYQFREHCFRKNLKTT